MMASFLTLFLSLFGSHFIATHAGCVQIEKKCSEQVLYPCSVEFNINMCMYVIIQHAKPTARCQAFGCAWDVSSGSYCKNEVDEVVAVPVEMCNCNERNRQSYPFACVKPCTKTIDGIEVKFRGCAWKYDKRQSLDEEYKVRFASDEIIRMETLERKSLRTGLSYVLIDEDLDVEPNEDATTDHDESIKELENGEDKYQIENDKEFKWDELLMRLFPSDNRIELENEEEMNDNIGYRQVKELGYRRIGLLLSNRRLSSTEYIESSCTASLISSNYIITAAHCIVDTDDCNQYGGIYKTGHLFYPGLGLNDDDDIDKALDPSNAYTLIESFVPRGYIRSCIDTPTGERNANIKKYDYALLRLTPKKKMPKHWFAFGYEDDKMLRKKNKFITAGYPIDGKNSDGKNSAGNIRHMYVGMQYLTNLDEQHVVDRLRKNYQGQSGSALWKQSDEGIDTIYAILSCRVRGYRLGFVGKHMYKKSIGTKFTRITKSRYKIIEAVLMRF